jgi:hypothetical protein
MAASLLGGMRLRVWPRGVQYGPSCLWGYTELQASLRAVPVAHQFLLKPWDPEMLLAGIARATSLGQVLDSKMLTSLVGSLRELPSLPQVFAELNLALARPSTTIDQVAQIVEQDVAVSAKILQLVNSAFFGLARDVSDRKTAVSCLGMSVLHDLVVTLEVFRSLTPKCVRTISRGILPPRATGGAHRCGDCP